LKFTNIKISQHNLTLIISTQYSIGNVMRHFKQCTVFHNSLQYYTIDLSQLYKAPCS